MGDGKTVHVSLSSPCVLCLRAERHVSLGQDSLLREKEGGGGSRRIALFFPQEAVLPERHVSFGP